MVVIINFPALKQILYLVSPVLSKVVGFLCLSLAVTTRKANACSLWTAYYSCFNMSKYFLVFQVDGFLLLRRPPPRPPLSVSRPKKTPQNEVKIFHCSFFKTGSKTTGRLKHFWDASLLLVWPQQCTTRYLYLLKNCRSKLIWWN